MIERAGSRPPINRATADDLRIAGDPLEIVGEHSGRQLDVASFAQIADHDLLEDQLAPRMPRDPVAKIQQQPRNARADRAQPDNGDLGVFP